MRVLIPVACTAVILTFAGSAAAQGKGAPKAKVATVKTTGATTTAKSAPVQKSNTTGHTKTTDTAKVTGHTKTATTTTNESPKKSTTTATVTTTGTTTTTLTPVQQKLLKNTNLAAMLETRLPPGTNLNAAAADFTSLGQFVSAVNVSHNLTLDFTELKTAILTDGKSLGQAIQAQKTTVDGTRAAAKAEKDADALIKSTESSSRTRKSKTKTDGEQ
jgi:hypothetical protein